MGLIGTRQLPWSQGYGHHILIQQSEVPLRQLVTYASFVCNHRPLKTEPWRVWLGVGGDKLAYTEDSGSPATNLVETKILVKSVISDAHSGARFMSCDLKDVYLATPMKKTGVYEDAPEIIP